MIHIEITPHNGETIAVEASLERMLFLKGEEALRIRAALRSGLPEEGLLLDIDGKPLEELKEGYLKADLPFDELREKMIDMLDHGVGYVFLDASENEFEEQLRRFIDHSFRYDKVLYFSSFVGEGLIVEEAGKKAEAPKAEEEESPYVEAIEEEKQEEPKKKEPLSLNHRLSGKEIKNLWINIAFACFFSFLCFLLPIVTLGKENTSETLLIISVVIGFVFCLFSNFPLVSYARGAKKEGNLSIKAVLINFIVHEVVSAGLAIGLFIMIKKNGYANLGYAYVAFLAVAPFLSILYCLLFTGILLKKKENR